MKRTTRELVDEFGHPTQFEESSQNVRSTFDSLCGWQPTRPDISPALGMLASQMVIRPSYVVQCLIHMWRYLKGTINLDMLSFPYQADAEFGNLR